MKDNRLLGLVLLFALLPSQGLFSFGNQEQEGSLVLYSGRGETLVTPLIQEFEAETGISVDVRYGGTAELALLIQEEGSRSPADLYWSQDAGALGQLAKEGLLANVPSSLTQGQNQIFLSSTQRWVATSGRARVFAYSPTRLPASQYPASVFDLTQERYKGRIGWAPTNGSFQAFVTALVQQHGEEKVYQWLVSMKANEAKVYRSNTALVEAIAAGEIDGAITNNYYLLRFLANDPNYPVAQRFFSPGDTGNMVNIAGIGILSSSDQPKASQKFIQFLLNKNSQAYFTQQINEYPVTTEVPANENLERLEALLELAPVLNLDDLADLEATLALLRRAEVL